MFLTELYVFIISPLQQYLWDWGKEITLLDIFRGTGQVTKGRECKSAQSVTTRTWEDTKQGKTAQPPWNRLFYTKVTNHILFSPMHCYHWKKNPIKHNSSRETEQWYLLYKVSPGISKVVCSKNQEKDKQKFWFTEQLIGQLLCYTTLKNGVLWWAVRKEKIHMAQSLTVHL